jgi:hypothetical protein
MTKENSKSNNKDLIGGDPTGFALSSRRGKETIPPFPKKQRAPSGPPPDKEKTFPLKVCKSKPRARVSRPGERWKNAGKNRSTSRQKRGCSTQRCAEMKREKRKDEN